MEFKQVYKTYFTSVYAYIRHLSGDAHVAEEITSETLISGIPVRKTERLTACLLGMTPPQTVMGTPPSTFIL